eukprot:CAMPEP_0203672214 /NCGR_PEP_ID=MMETSP0090-20130426/7778_1 /ASSEMBLY_ACC=CAM_ASM_001088 /TAXON_ID=426623 /ORGANISM="Chaetoceros affinis, Strain CCMP159" /LENGTH=679 /DNA_ID=CAMNT_0050537481 /DNA_START=163 /DNA_END=2202 /DNA_ORIENTATION=-
MNAAATAAATSHSSSTLQNLILHRNAFFSSSASSLLLAPRRLRSIPSITSRAYSKTTSLPAAAASSTSVLAGGSRANSNSNENHSTFFSPSSSSLPFLLTTALVLGGGGGGGSAGMYYRNENDCNSNSTKCSALMEKEEEAQAHPTPTPSSVGLDKNFEDKTDASDDLHLPIFTSEQVAENNGEDGKPIWMSYGGIVYDVTEFIHNHPGGSERILLAAGSAIEPYWHLYRQHFATDLPMRLMEDLIIGKLDEKSQDEIDNQMEKIIEENDDPYLNEPTDRSEQLIVHGDQPMNAEVPADLITESYITPVELFYIRHHHPVPLLRKEEVQHYEIEVDLSNFVDYLNEEVHKDKKDTVVVAPKSNISLDDIKKLPKVEVITTLQCSGNRRGDMNKVKRTSGTAWGQGAISTAKWGGARLVDVLKLAGVINPYDLTEKDGTQKHVRFESLDGMKASIGMEKATNPYGDVIIAYEMNGEPIPREHGFPLRAIVPGYSAVRNVKWVKKIEISTEEAEGAWQRGLNYKTLPPNVTDAKSINLENMPSMTESSLFSGITKMEVIKDTITTGNDDSDSKNNMSLVKAKGWAWAGGGRNIVRVDVTGDEGKSWTTANIVQGGDQKFGRAWAWVFWECDIPVQVEEGGTIRLASKAVDMAFNSQPENADHGWNVRGLGNNSWYRREQKV